jgi:hypothetical protein
LQAPRWDFSGLYDTGGIEEGKYFSKVQSLQRNQLKQYEGMITSGDEELKFHC